MNLSNNTYLLAQIFSLEVGPWVGNSWVNLSDNTYLRAKIFSLEVGPGGEILGEPAEITLTCGLRSSVLR